MIPPVVREKILKVFGVTQQHQQRPLPPAPAFSAGYFDPTAILTPCLRDGYPGQMDILHHGPDDGETAGFRRVGVDLIRALPHVDFQNFQSHWCCECNDA
jgi:hypothetical protein